MRKAIRFYFKTQMGAFAILLIGLLQATARPALYFYPSAHRLSDGSVVHSPITVEPWQITTGFPEIKEMAGVALIVYWSRMCPAENRCDYSLIDKVLSYWRARGKKVVLGVATVGFPLRTIRDGAVTYEGATPAWVLARVSHYTAHSRVLDIAGSTKKIAAEYPSYNDPRFVAFVKGLVKSLAVRYDGNPAIAQLRISTGLTTEDNPSVDGLRSPMPGFTDSMWIRFCRTITDIYIDSFKHTILEFDVGRISWSLAGWNAEGEKIIRNNQETMREARQFFEYLLKQQIFLAFNGLSDETQPLLPDSKETQNGVTRSLHLLIQAKHHRLPVGLEAMSPVYAPRMRNIGAIGQVVCYIDPDRLIFFATLPSLIDYERHGKSTKNQLSLQAFKPARIAELARQADDLLRVTDTEKYCTGGGR